ncbi:hypothetical protein KY308_03130 [Candidatus Woesearchaeota archaeon]|nr:hypothetical protein [Candidatus Woesearchaeota archaeon]
MIIIKAHFDIEKWESGRRSVVQPYIQDLVRKELVLYGIHPDSVVYRGGFGRAKAVMRLGERGTDYSESSAIKIKHEGVMKEAIYASLFDRLGSSPRERGIDPLYWAIKGHPDDSGYNPESALALFWKSKLIPNKNSDVFAFKSVEPSVNNVAAVIFLKFEKQSLEKRVSEKPSRSKFKKLEDFAQK